VIGCLGLFGLTSFAAEQRTKEIGIRKVLGASVQGVVWMLVREFTKWVLLAVLIAWPVGYLVMNSWLQNFFYRINVGFDTLILAAVLALIIAIITVSYQAVKAALANPADSLKYE
jgi:putative ABC transport system permease protein